MARVVSEEEVAEQEERKGAEFVERIQNDMVYLCVDSTFCDKDVGAHTLIRPGSSANARRNALRFGLELRALARPQR